MISNEQVQQELVKNIANIPKDLHQEPRGNGHLQNSSSPNRRSALRHQHNPSRGAQFNLQGSAPHGGYDRRGKSPIIDHQRIVDRNPIVQSNYPTTFKGFPSQYHDQKQNQGLRAAQRPQVYGSNIQKQPFIERIPVGVNTRYGPAAIANQIQKSVQLEYARQPELPINKGLLKIQDLIISDQTVQKIMGPEPVPQLDIEISEIQNELQRKMIEEIVCVMCQQFPYSPLECKKCNKLFCKHCQLELEQASSGVATGRHSYNEFIAKGSHGHDVCCPNCQERGHFLQEINKVLRNCIDFCEFPHKCYLENRKNGGIIWKTLLELQEHAIYDCPKFGCDICYQEQFQHLTRAQLFNHIKTECPEVMVQCPTCSMEFVRGDYAQHECLKDKFMKRLKMHQYEVVEYLAEHLMRLRRQKEGLGFCLRQECVEKFKESNQYKAGQGMITPNTNQKHQSGQCLRCKTVVPAYEDSYFCLFCNDCYCGYCQGYAKYFDLAELESIIMSENVLKLQ